MSSLAALASSRPMRRHSHSHSENLFAAGSRFLSQPALASAARNAASSAGCGSILSLCCFLAGLWQLLMSASKRSIGPTTAAAAKAAAEMARVRPADTETAWMTVRFEKSRRWADGRHHCRAAAAAQRAKRSRAADTAATAAGARQLEASTAALPALQHYAFSLSQPEGHHRRPPACRPFVASIGQV